MKIRVLGIDPGSRVTGYGIVELNGTDVSYVKHGALDLLRNTTNFSDRLALLGQNLRLILSEFSPQHVAVERVFLGRNADSAFKLGHARGVAVYESAIQGCQLHEYATREVKKGITGSGASEKIEVMEVLYRLLKISNREQKSFDASDALALAYFHCHKLQMQNLIRRSVQI